MTENQEVEKKIMSIVAEDGSVEEVEVILAFEFKDTKKARLLPCFNFLFIFQQPESATTALDKSNLDL